MPYSPPGVVAPSLPSPAPSSHSHAHAGSRPNHRRSYTFAADDPRAGPGAFGSLGALPRRSSSHSHSFASSSSSSSSPRKFHFRGEVDNDDSSSSSDEQQRKDDDDDDGPPPPLRLRQAPPAFRLTPATTFHGHRASPPRSPQRSPNSSATNVPAFNTAKLNTALSPVPFPRSSLSGPNSPLSPNSNGGAGGGYPARPPGPARTASHPVILLSNGKPLKSSLKSSSSAPHVLTPNAPPHHLRARSAPSTPMLGSPPSATPEAWAGGDSPLSPSTPKAVHFPPPDAGLEDIRLFKRSARPTSVSFPGSLEEETETETETDRDAPRIAVWGEKEKEKEKEGYPFPRVGAGRSPLNPNQRPHTWHSHSSAGAHKNNEWRYVLDAPGVPRRANDGDMVLLEALTLEGPASPSSTTSTATTTAPPTTDAELTLHGTLLARNVAFEKHVFVRFTLDGWCTTSEVGGRYVGAAASPFAASRSPSSSSSPSPGDATTEEEHPGPGWDRFAFSIRLTDYAGAAAGGVGGSGKSRVGRGLEGRTLVLVGRFFAPWVRAGGVGPYVWCDTLPAAHLTPGTQAGTDVSPRGRAWVGTGAGGAGEWWDNNGGADYKVAFRCVDVEPAAGEVPALAPAQTQTQAQTNVIPFPSSVEPTAPSAPSSTQQSQASTQQAPQQAGKPIPPPPPPRTAHAQALAAKLGRLSLRNYAAPGGRAMSLPGLAPVSAAALAVVNNKGDAQKSEGDTKVEAEKPAPGTQSAGGVGLYWPWATTTTTTAAASSVSAAAAAPTPARAQDDHDSDDDEEARRDAEAGRARRASSASTSSVASSTFTAGAEDDNDNETPPTSPLGAGGLLPVIEGMELDFKHEDKGEEQEQGDKDKDKEDWTPTNEGGFGSGSGEKDAYSTPLPASPETGSPQTSSSPAPGSPGANAPISPLTSPSSSSLYKAFVRQWCFAGNGASGGSGAPATGKGPGVLGVGGMV